MNRLFVVKFWSPFLKTKIGSTRPEKCRIEKVTNVDFYNLFYVFCWWMSKIFHLLLFTYPLFRIELLNSHYPITQKIQRRKKDKRPNHPLGTSSVSIVIEFYSLTFLLVYTRSLVPVFRYKIKYKTKKKWNKRK